jgi:hypothetical protein
MLRDDTGFFSLNVIVAFGIAAPPNPNLFLAAPAPLTIKTPALTLSELTLLHHEAHHGPNHS